MKNVAGMAVAITTIVTVGLTVNFLMAPNIPVVVPTSVPDNLKFQIPYGKFGANKPNYDNI